LSELTTCLATDWGNRLLTVHGEQIAAFGPHVASQRIAQIRALCLKQPKFGNGDKLVDRWAWWLLETFRNCVDDTRKHRVHAKAFERLEAQFGSPKHPFRIHLAPGVGTFEQYVFSGSFNGASADGRRSGGPVASDLSPAPVPHDLPATMPEGAQLRHVREFELNASLNSYSHRIMSWFGDGAPVDYNIREDLPEAELVKFLRKFADRKGGSVCTFTAANPETFLDAQQNPAHHNLLRVRMGGWTEFFIALFPDHQEQHKRRPLYG
jgi:pyruvate-formate lyase